MKTPISPEQSFLNSIFGTKETKAAEAAIMASKRAADSVAEKAEKMAKHAAELAAYLAAREERRKADDAAYLEAMPK
jgi:hypothetical protein